MFNDKVKVRLENRGLMVTGHVAMQKLRLSHVIDFCGKPSFFCAVGGVKLDYNLEKQDHS